ALRESTNLSQREFADRLGLDQSRVSRIESGAVSASEDECALWLDASRPADAERVRIWMRTPWSALGEPAPPWNHPDVVVLALAAEAVRRLSEDSPASLRASVDQYRDELVA